MKFLLITVTIIEIANALDLNSNSILKPPIVINTWNFSSANARAWQELASGHSALDAVEFGCMQCQLDRCDGTVGWGGSPSETGEVTLDAMLMDGDTLAVGAVGGLRRVRNAISVARAVLEHTNHTLLVGEMATSFALEMEFKEEPMESRESDEVHRKWLADSCQPNYWRGPLQPDPRKSCGPYKPLRRAASIEEPEKVSSELKGRDTIGMIALDSRGKLASGTSTNGLRHKILGRVGDSPIPGAGSYAVKGIGAAACTGDGDVIMRFLLSYQAVESLRLGMSAQEAADDAIKRLTSRLPRPWPEAALVVLSSQRLEYGSACVGFSSFPHILSDAQRQLQVSVTNCTQ